MLISTKQNTHTLWQQKQDLFDQLGLLANLSIFDEPQEKEALKTKLLEFIYSHSFDPIYGGLLINRENNGHKETLTKYYKPLLINLYLHEIFMAADQVFYDGELNHQGRLIFRYLIARLENKEIEFDRYDEIKNIDNYFSYEQINNQLNDKEKKLFIALISEDKHSDNGYLFCYKRSLKEASNSINMEYKQAQILDFSIKEKLKAIEDKENSSTKIKIQDSFSTKCELIISLVSHGLSEFNKKQEKLLFNLFEGLYIEIKEDNNYKKLIDLITSGIYLLQLNFDLKILSKLDKLIIVFYKNNNVSEKSNRDNLRIALLDQFITELSSRNILPNNFNNMDAKTNKKLDRVFELIFLDKNQVDTASKLVEMRSKYNPYRLIYLTSTRDKDN